MLNVNKQTIIAILSTVLLMASCESPKSVDEEKVNKNDLVTIKSIMKQQEDCWNSGDLECFMEGYWKSDSLKFIGSSGLTYGWQVTLDSYHKTYPDRSAMGKLTFKILDLEAIDKNTVLLLGTWALKREIGDVDGFYSLVWKKKKGKWVIVADHSS
jgi:hypothetical protein